MTSATRQTTSESSTMRPAVLRQYSASHAHVECAREGGADERSPTAACRLHVEDRLQKARRGRSTADGHRRRVARVIGDENAQSRVDCYVVT